MSDEIIRGGRPRTFPVGAPQGRTDLIRIYGISDEGQEHTVPEGQVLVIPEYGAAPGGLPETRREFPAGTRFRLLDAGDPHTRAVTSVLA